MSVPPPLLVPTQRAAVVGANGQASNEWYEFFRRLLAYMQQTGVDPAVIASILARLDELEQDAIGNFLIQGLLSVEVQGTPANGAVVLQLLNDDASPGANYQYSTDVLEQKGWHRATDLTIYLVDENGNYLTDEDGNLLTDGPLDNHNALNNLQAAPNAVDGERFHISSEQADAVGPLSLASDSRIQATTAGATQSLYSPASKIITVYAADDLPAAVAGVITLADNTSYYITTAIDVGANRIQCGLNNALHGDDADNCSLTATGLAAGTAFITSTSSLSIQSITIKDVGTAFSLNDSTNQLAWRNLRLQNIPTIGTIQNYANIVWSQCVLDNSANLTFQGTVGSLAFTECLFDGRTGQATLTVPAAAVISRRLRFLYCVAIVLPGETGFNVSTSATIPDEGYVLDNMAFSGGGTYLAGLDYTSNKALFFNSTGITNSSVLCQYSMTGNATATVIGAASTFVKVAGTTTASSLNQKFSTATTQRAAYTGAFPGNFRVIAFASMTSGNNQTLRMRVAKNGTTIAESNTLFKTTGSGEASAVGCQVITSLVPTDYLELFVTNDTAATNITVSDLNFTVTRL